MGEPRRKADGRRVFTTEFKRETVQRILTGEKTVAELSRELDIALPRVQKLVREDPIDVVRPVEIEFPPLPVDPALELGESRRSPIEGT